MQVKMDINEYLKRIGCEDAKEVSYENLAKIRKAHSSTFTFENIDMHMGVPIKFSLEDSYDRLMNRSRGGLILLKSINRDKAI
jgi:N-hydroxyarylamine O-acetyltransferase